MQHQKQQQQEQQVIAHSIRCVASCVSRLLHKVAGEKGMMIIFACIDRHEIMLQLK
jgi:hypothetical protein